MHIARAAVHDLPGAYRTCLLTGDGGRDATALFRDPELLGHVYVGPYIVRGIGTQWVAHDDHGSAGYLLSADDSVAFEAWAEQTWWPSLRARYPILDDDSIDAEVIGIIHAPPRTPPELAHPFPAHLHIDLQERARGQGLGRRLVADLLSGLRSRHVPGVHLRVDGRNDGAIAFYGHLGFEVLASEPGGLIMGLRLTD
jgi:ribosomal protein S18 acetylase RimI-like enzyme